MSCYIPGTINCTALLHIRQDGTEKLSETHQIEANQPTNWCTRVNNIHSYWYSNLYEELQLTFRGDCTKCTHRYVVHQEDLSGFIPGIRPALDLY